MVYLQADYIITPLGEGVPTNLDAIAQGRTMLQLHASVHGEELVHPVMASLLDEQRYQMEGYSLFESLCIRAIECALQGLQINLDKTVFILSSTKGDIWVSMADTAAHIATYFGNTNPPVVVSTACTSGVAAQIVAQREIESGHYESAIVVGTDIQREFIVSGFQSFHALSDQPCKPFDKNRDGLNAGEAVACMILGNHKSGLGWTLLGGSIHNDANHISGPSRTAEGSYRCLNDMLQRVDKNDLACISVHGTGTPYNDEMESIAIYRADLDQVPVSALKGIYGHTMGAAGLLETILSLHALAEGYVLPATRYEEQGTTYGVNISSQIRQTNQKSLIKLLSGFGGVNAAVAWTVETTTTATTTTTTNYKAIAEVKIDASANIIDTYKQLHIDYPKFYKMDLLSKLGFVSVEMLLNTVKQKHPDFVLDAENTAIILASHSASLKNDTDFQATIQDKNNYYPSPALFVYTLPNIVTGELAIRHHIYGETSCFILTNSSELQHIKNVYLNTTSASSIIIGWVECENENKYETYVELLIKS